MEPAVEALLAAVTSAAPMGVGHRVAERRRKARARVPNLIPRIETLPKPIRGADLLNRIINDASSELLG